jgi:hypothetical protein
MWILKRYAKQEFYIFFFNKRIVVFVQVNNKIIKFLKKHIQKLEKEYDQ